MKTKKILHILRNPYCWSEVEKKQARLGAADLIERLQKLNKERMNIAEDQTDDLIANGLLKVGDAKTI